jgi:hypothetical protein
MIGTLKKLIVPPNIIGQIRAEGSLGFAVRMYRIHHDDSHRPARNRFRKKEEEEKGKWVPTVKPLA